MRRGILRHAEKEGEGVGRTFLDMGGRTGIGSRARNGREKRSKERGVGKRVI